MPASELEDYSKIRYPKFAVLHTNKESVAKARSDNSSNVPDSESGKSGYFPLKNPHSRFTFSDDIIEPPYYSKTELPGHSKIGSPNCRELTNKRSRISKPIILFAHENCCGKETLLDDEIEPALYSEQTNEQINVEEQMIMSTDIINAPVSELESMPETWELFTFLDTGGQPEFINILPAINSSTAVTFVVLNISDGEKCISNKVLAQYECEGYNYEECTLKYTNLYLLKCLMSSVKVAAMTKDYFNPEIVTRVAKDEHPTPVIYIIGTCVDKLKEKFGEKYNEEILKIDEEVTKLVNVIKDKDVLEFQCKHYNKKFVHVIPVDNTISRGSQEDRKCETAKTIQIIREHCNTILRNKAQYEIPIAWFILELELRNNTKVCIP